MQKNTINYDDWLFVIDRTDFENPSFQYSLGWYDETITTDYFPHEEQKYKLFPQLIYLYATFKPNSGAGNLLSKKPEEIKQLFLKFFSKDLSTIILNFAIIAPLRNEPAEAHFIYSLKNYCFIPKNPDGYPHYYEFLLPDFWIRNKIYRSYKFDTTKESNKFKYSPFELQREAIFSAIWKSYCQLETRPIITQLEFVEILFALANLAEDTLAKPINRIDEKSLSQRKAFFSAHQHPEDCGDFGMNPERWNKEIPKNREEVFTFRILDSKDYLNSFFTKYSYLTMGNALELFLIKMFESFADDLVKNNLLAKCAFCGEYFQFQKGKKYCSLITEGKDCGKTARNKRYYSTKGKERLPKYRQTTQELRAFYKEKGI